jgi:predicted Zn finger-like uncharacterized protein
MAEVILNCPQCRRSLRVTDDLVGRPVKCPACGMTFTVASGQRTSEETMTHVAANAPVPPRSHQTEARWESIEDARANARAYTMPAGILLIFAGSLSIVAGLWNMANWLLQPAKMMEDATKFEEFFGPLPPQEALQFGALLAGILTSAIALSLVVAGIQMIRLKMYPVCIAGSVLAMLNCCNPCCVFSLPLGLWSLIVLVKTDVRAAFQ